jgi:23S rRNA (cytosine1962-C5)-methyltransferase
MHGALPTIEVECGDWAEYELLDSGAGRKLERFGPNRVNRPEPRAWWRPSRPTADWQTAVASFDEESRWTLGPGVVREWRMPFEGLAFCARFTETSKHVGVFPEQAPQWRWIMRAGRACAPRGRRLLNLFGYTGAATLAAAASGFSVTHVDASRPAVAWARQNQQASGLDRAPIRWILDDALKFVRREVRRGQRYDAIVLDPPSYGRGPKGELWKIEEQLPELLGACRDLLSETPAFVNVTLYSLDVSVILIGNLLADMMRGHAGPIRHSELVLRQNVGDRLLPLSLCARWQADGLAVRNG